ncbi:hypothetical protein AB0G54_15285 [Streptomyces yokosukanensis]|uniref:hypothetical protein n=1 Tax=Streptomyces yokosukanensis TaxID=67386 RepID=UPI003416E8A8
MTAKQQIRWGIFVLYVVFVTSAILTFDLGRPVVWGAYSAVIVATAALVALWNKKKPGDGSSYWRLWI